jgi:hypothetical protein
VEDVTTTQLLKWALLLIAAFMWLTSLIMPGVRASDGMEWPGFMLLLLGWIGVLTLQPAWLANPIWIVAGVLIACDKRLGAPLALAGLAVSLIALAPFEMIGANAASGGTARVAFGFWIWMTTGILLVAAGVLGASPATSVREV